MDVQLIVSDIDGTLTEKVGITDRTKKTLESLKEKGVRLGIASGRPYYAVTRSVRGWGLKYDPDFIIGMNGAQLYDFKDGQLLEQHLLSTDTIREVYDYMAPFRNQTNMFIYEDERTLFEKEDELYTATFIKYYEVESVDVAEDLEEFFTRPIAKLLFRLYDISDMPKIEKYIAEHPNPHFVGFKTRPNLMEFVDPWVNKYAAVEEYIRKYQIPNEKVAAFGDTTNDLEMIRDCGIGVAMCNGTDDVKKVADYISEKPCSEDGFADFVGRNILKDL